MRRGHLDVAHGFEPFGDRGGNAIHWDRDIKPQVGIVRRGNNFPRSNLADVLHIHNVGTAPDDGLQLGCIINATLGGCPDLMVNAIESKNEIFFQRLDRRGERVMTGEQRQACRGQSLTRRGAHKHDSATIQWVNKGFNDFFLRRQEPDLRNFSGHVFRAVHIKTHLLSGG